MVGLVKSSHVVGVVSVTKPERSIENILSDYNVPKEVIQLVSERNKELEALDALKKEIQGGNKIELKKQYDGVDNDGDAQPFLKRFYEDDIKSGRLNAANLRVIDKKLYDRIHYEIHTHNENYPDNQKKLSDYLPTKEDVMRKRKERFFDLFQGCEKDEVIDLIRGIVSPYQSKNL